MRVRFHSLLLTIVEFVVGGIAVAADGVARRVVHGGVWRIVRSTQSSSRSVLGVVALCKQASRVVAVSAMNVTIFHPGEGQLRWSASLLRPAVIQRAEAHCQWRVFSFTLPVAIIRRKEWT